MRRRDSNKTVIFDLDDTLIYTDKLRFYRNTFEGREFIENNVDRLPTTLCREGIVDLVERLQEKCNVLVGTNSNSGFASRVLKKHGFDVEEKDLLTALNKPVSQKLRMDLIGRRIDFKRSLMIGDSARDIVVAKNLGMGSVAVGWGKYNSRKQLESSCPDFIVDSVSDLENTIETFLGDGLEFLEPDLLELDLFEGLSFVKPEMNFLYLQDYYSWNGNREMFYNSNSNKVLRFKESKDFFLKDIRNGLKRKYFFNGALKMEKESYYSIINDFYLKFINSLGKDSFPGKTCLLASPNSFLDYCYSFDVNQKLVSSLNNYVYGIEKSRREIKRVYPVSPSHLSNGERSEARHFNSIGIMNDIDLNYDNLIVFDDILTTGSQLSAIGVMLRKMGYDGNLYGLTIGYTIG